MGKKGVYRRVSGKYEATWVSWGRMEIQTVEEIREERDF